MATINLHAIPRFGKYFFRGRAPGAKRNQLLVLEGDSYIENGTLIMLDLKQ